MWDTPQKLGQQTLTKLVGYKPYIQPDLLCKEKKVMIK